PAEAEAECLEPHVFHRHVAGENQKIGPGDFAAILLLDWPEQPPRFVLIRVVGPAVERSEALRTLTAAAATVGDPVRACGMPRHADEERPIVTVIGWPPLLRRPHHLNQVALEGLHVEALELFRVVETFSHRIGTRRVPMEDR